MLKSMTGYGKYVLDHPQKKITVECRSLNSKQLDASVKLPYAFRIKEHEIRSMLSKELERGKVDFSIYVELLSDTDNGVINKSLAKTYFNSLKSLASDLNQTDTDILAAVIRMPDVYRNEKTDVDEEEWKEIESGIKKALEDLSAFRKKEGKILETDFVSRIKSLHEKLSLIQELDPKRMEKIREKINNNLEENFGKEKIDQNRFEQEMIYFLEKIDITEEKVRLKAHLDYFTKTLYESSTGRKLGFIAQEIGREINTIGSKANDAEIQKIVVEMKDELEKIKEQINNVL